MARTPVTDAADANGYALTTDNGQTGSDTASTEGETHRRPSTTTRKVGSLTVTKETEGSGLEEGYPNTHETYSDHRELHRRPPA